MAEPVNQDNVQSTSQLQANERVCEFSYKKDCLSITTANNKERQRHIGLLRKVLGFFKH